MCGVLPFSDPEADDAADQSRRHQRPLSGLDGPPVNDLQAAPDSESGEDAVSNGAGHVGDAPDDHVRAHDSTGDPRHGLDQDNGPKNLSEGLSRTTAV
jgi:hypothetical protein